MKKKNKSNFEIALITRNNLLNNKKKVNCYDLVVCKKSMHNKRFVVEKIGSYNFNKLIINNFRLVYWLQYNASFNIKANIILSKYFFLLKYIKNN